MRFVSGGTGSARSDRGTESERVLKLVVVASVEIVDARFAQEFQQQIAACRQHRIVKLR